MAPGRSRPRRGRSAGARRAPVPRDVTDADVHGSEGPDEGERQALLAEQFDEVLAAALDSLEADGLLSDARCAEMIVHARTSRGQGPAKVRQALRDAGLDAQCADAALEAADVDWASVLERVCEQRFGSDAPEDAREWAKRARFLTSRGFSEGLVRRHLGEIPFG